MPYLMVRHRVADFDQWKAAFDAHQAARAEAGCSTLDELVAHHRYDRGHLSPMSR